jgi:PAS domain S-box-containing protein
MTLFQNLSIRNKLIGIILLVTILALGRGFTFVTINDLKSFKKDMKNHTVVTAQVIGDYCVSPLIFGDNTGAEQIVAKLAAIPSIVNAIVYDADGEPFASFAKSEDAIITAPTVQERSIEFVDNYLHVFQPIIYKNEHYGTIYFRVSTQLLSEKINAYLRYMVLLMTGLTIVSILLAVRLQRIISQPILNLAGVAQQIAEEEDYSIRVQKKGHDETGLLYDGFNNMLDQIQNRERERDRAEEALRESETKFRTLTSNVPGAVYRCANDPHWTMDFISDVIEEISCYNASDFIQNKVRSYASIIHQDDRKMVEEIARKAISERMPYIIEYRIVRSDGIIRWVYEKGQGIFSDDGILLWLDGAIFDITESKQAELELAKYRKHLEELVETRTTELTNANKQLQQEIAERKLAEEALRENEEKFKSISASAQDAIIMIDNDGNISYWNEAAEKIFGYTKKEVIGKELHRFLGPERYYGAYRKAFGKFQKTGKGAVIGKTLELAGVKKDGIEFPLELSLSSVKIRGKWNAIGIVRDITARKLAEDKLRESEERFRDVALSTSDWVWEVDKQGRYTYCSERVVDVLGYTADEILGKTPFGLMSSDEATRVGKIFKEIIRNKEPIVDIENWNINRQGHNVCLLTNGVPVFDTEGNLCGYRGVDKDVTERKQAEEALRQSEEKYRSLVANIPTVTWTSDCEGNTDFISPNIEKVYGFTPEEIYQSGQHLWLGRIHPDDIGL